MTAGSTLWLMRHELRLAWRAGEQKTRWARLAIFGFLFLLMGGAGVPMGWALRGHAAAVDGIAIAATAASFAFITVMSFATSLSFTAASFVDRGDMELLLSSPLPMRRLLTVRLSATALRSVSLWLMLFGPPFIAIACLAGPRWLSGLLLLADAGLIGTALSTWLAVGLFRAIGTRRVRSTTTVITTLSGLSAGLVPTLFNARFKGPDHAGDMARLIDRVTAVPFFSADGLGSLPARALYGDPLAGLLLSGAALGLMLATTWLMAPSFARLAIQGDPQQRPAAGNAPLRGFGGSLFRQVLLKDYRLLLRNHALLLQILGRSIAFVPLLVINLTRHGASFDLAQVAGALTLVLGQTGGATVWAFIAAETQPDLLASSPHPARLFIRGRLIAGLLPSLALVVAGALLMAPRSRLAGLAVLILGTAACLSSAAINAKAKAVPGKGAWNKMPRPSLPAQFTDMASGAAWAATAWLLATGSVWAALPAWIGISIVWLWREAGGRQT